MAVDHRMNTMDYCKPYLGFNGCVSLPNQRKQFILSIIGKISFIF